MITRSKSRVAMDNLRLVETAQQTLSGVDPHIVRNSGSLRQHITAELSIVQSVGWLSHDQFTY